MDKHLFIYIYKLLIYTYIYTLSENRIVKYFNMIINHNKSIVPNLNGEKMYFLESMFSLLCVTLCVLFWI